MFRTRDEKTDGKDSVGETENDVYVSENLMTVYSSITVDMLDACNTVVSDLDSYYDSYYHDSLVLLNWFNDDTRLYGINAGEESAMLLYVQGEKNFDSIFVLECIFRASENECL